MNRVTNLEIGEDYVLTHNGNPYWKCDNYRETIISKPTSIEQLRKCYRAYMANEPCWYRRSFISQYRKYNEISYRKRAMYIGEDNGKHYFTDTRTYGSKKKPWYVKELVEIDLNKWTPWK